MIENWWPTQIGYYDNPNHVDISSHCLDVKNRVEHPNITTISKDTYITYKNYNIIGKPEFYSINNFVFKVLLKFIKSLSALNFEFAYTPSGAHSSCSFMGFL